MDRRAFVLAALAGAASPRTAFAQAMKKVWRVGYLSVATVEADRSWLAAFRDELRKLGYVEGQNVLIEDRHAGGYADKLAALAAELLGLKLDVLVVYGVWHIADKLKGMTPVVFTVVPDRPGGNITGF